MSNENYTVLHLHSDMSNGVTNIDSVTKYIEYIKEIDKDTYEGATYLSKALNNFNLS